MNAAPFRSVAQRWDEHSGSAAPRDPFMRLALILAYHAGFASALQACDEAAARPTDEAQLRRALALEISTALARAAHITTNGSVQ